MIVRIQNSIPQVKVTSSTIYIITSFLCSILKIKVWIKETTFPGNIYIALFAGKYKKYCPALAFDLPTQIGAFCFISYPGKEIDNIMIATGITPGDNECVQMLYHTIPIFDLICENPA